MSANIDLLLGRDGPSQVSEGEKWCQANPDILFKLHSEGQFFLAVHPLHGVLISDSDEEEFEAKMNDRRPSFLRQLYFTNTHLWVCTVNLGRMS